MIIEKNGYFYILNDNYIIYNLHRSIIIEFISKMNPLNLVELTNTIKYSKIYINMKILNCKYSHILESRINSILEKYNIDI